MNKNVGMILSSMAVGSLVALVIEGITARFVLGSVFRRGIPNRTERQANRYYPVQSPSEVAAGHPIVGVS